MLVQLDPIHFGDLFFLSILVSRSEEFCWSCRWPSLLLSQYRFLFSQQTLEMPQGKLIFCYLGVFFILPPVELI